MYALKNKEEERIKIKGLSEDAIISNEININLLKELLVKDSNHPIQQFKWFKHLFQANMSIKEQLYTLSVTSSNRKILYDQSGVFIESIPYNLSKGKLLL